MPWCAGAGSRPPQKNGSRGPGSMRAVRPCAFASSRRKAAHRHGRPGRRGHRGRASAAGGLRLRPDGGPCCRSGCRPRQRQRARQRRPCPGWRPARWRAGAPAQGVHRGSGVRVACLPACVVPGFSWRPRACPLSGVMSAEGPGTESRRVPVPGGAVSLTCTGSATGVPQRENIPGVRPAGSPVGGGTDAFRASTEAGAGVPAGGRRPCLRRPALGAGFRE